MVAECLWFILWLDFTIEFVDSRSKLLLDRFQKKMFFLMVTPRYCDAICRSLRFEPLPSVVCITDGASPGV